MTYINAYIEQNMPRIQEYFIKLGQVEDLSQHKKNSQYQSLLRQEKPIIRIAVNDIFGVHKLLVGCVAAVAPTRDDPMRVILRELGLPPSCVPPTQNKGINLKLVNRFDTPLDEEGDDSGSIEAIMQETRWQLTKILRLMAHIQLLQTKYNVDTTSLLAVLSKAKQEAIAGEDFRLADMIKQLLGRLDILASKKVYNHTKLLQDVSKDLRDRDQIRAIASQEKLTLQTSLEQLRARRTFLLTQVSAYRESLLSARDLCFNPKQLMVGGSGGCFSKPTMHRDFRMGPHRYSYIALERKGFVHKSSLPEQFRPHLTFVFEMSSPGVVRLSVVAKQAAQAGMAERDSTIFNSQILVEDLLEGKDKKLEELNLQEVVLDLPQVLDIVNKHFIE